MTASVEIKAELKLEDLASEVLKQIRGEVEGTSKEVDEAKNTWKDWAASAAQNLHNLGINVKDVAMQVVEFGKSFVDAAAGGQSADTALGGLISAVQGIPFDEANEKAKKFHDEMDDIAISAGAVGNVEEAFHKLVDFTGATNEGLARARGNISSLSNISGVLGKDVNAITQEFALMQEGTIRTKGQLFQLLQSTGAFGQESKKVAAEWTKLTDEKRAAILDQAIGKIAGKFENIPKTFNNWQTSLANLGDVAKEQLGEPFMNALSPALEEVAKVITELKPDLLELAEAIGGEFKTLVDGALDSFREGIAYLKTHKAEIKEVGETIRQAWGYAKDVMSFILAHKEEIALAFGAKMAGDGLASAVAMGGKVKSAFSDLPAALNKSVGALNALTVILGATSIAFSLIGKELDELDDFNDNKQGSQKNNDKVMLEAGKAALAGNVSKVDSLYTTQKNFDAGKIKGADSVDFDDSFQGKNLLKLLAEAKKTRAQMDQETAAYTQGLAQNSVQVGDALRKAGKDHYEGGKGLADEIVMSQAQTIALAYNQAITAGNMNAAQAAANYAQNSVAVQEALLQSGLVINGGLDQFAAMITDKAGVLAVGLMNFAGGSQFGGKTGKNIIVGAGGTGSGNVTMNIKQDFRNQDPDRIAVVFRRDIQKQAEQKYQSSSTSLFG